jgi:large subunit ribosomal protein L25
MAEIASIPATKRAQAGRGNARALRRAGKVPGTVYGDKKDPDIVSLDEKALGKEYNRGGFLSRLYDLEVDGVKTRVLPREVQIDPVYDQPIHVDFMRVAPKARIRLMIPMVFTGSESSPGIKRGGVLNIVRHEIECYCQADAIPEHISASIAAMDIGSSLHISHIALPAGVKPVITTRDFTVATLAVPTLLTEVEEKPAAAAEGEAAMAEGEAGAEGAAPAEGAEAKPGDAKGKGGAEAKAPAAAKGKGGAEAKAPAAAKGKGGAEAAKAPAAAKGKKK